MKILSNKSFVAVLVVTAALAGTAYAKSIFDLEYPIAELGGCADKKACKVYCDAPNNQEACDAFAASYGIGEAKKRVEDRRERRELAMKDGGPGNCAVGADDPEKSCRTYCDSPEHLNQCVAYGKSRGLLKGRELEEAEKVANALASGVALPEGCTSAESCKQMCEEPKNIGIARACFAFAEKAGILPPHVDRVQAEKVFKLIEEGKAPFKSPKDFKQCENPESDEVMEKCLKFGEENDLIPQKDLEMIKKTGGKGPGGCRGKAQCDLYCEEHQDECMKFAEEHNLIAPEDKARMEEGLARFKEGIVNAPAEVKQCLEGIVGRDVLEQMIAGRQTPKRDFGDKMRMCFENVFGKPDERKMREGEFPRIMRPEGEDEAGVPPIGGMPSMPMQSRPPQRGAFPPQVEECVKGKVGGDALREIGGEAIGRDSAVGQAISECMREFEGPREGGSFQGGGERGQMMPPQFDRGQGTSSRMWEPRPEGQFDPRMLIHPEFQNKPTMPAEGLMYPSREMPTEMMPKQTYPSQGGAMPYGAPQGEPYPPMPIEGMMPQSGETGTFITPTIIAEPIN